MKPEDGAGRTLSVQSASWQKSLAPQKSESRCCCNKGVGADKRVCVKCFKHELNCDVNDG